MSFALGVGGAYLLFGKAFSVWSQASTEAQLENRIRFIELIEQNKVECLKKVLIEQLESTSEFYESNLENFFWEKNSYSVKILEQVKHPRDFDDTACLKSDSGNVWSYIAIDANNVRLNFQLYPIKSLNYETWEISGGYW